MGEQVQTIRRTGAAVVLLIAVAALAACRTTQVTHEQVTADYEAGRYAQALEGAASIARGAHGARRIEARYIAGISAYRLGRSGEALAHLTPVARSDDALAGHAAATVGLIYAGRGDYASAQQWLSSAASKLNGEDRARVHYHLGVAEQHLGQWQAARRDLSLAVSYSGDARLREAARQRMATDAFALQFGAYSNLELARQHAAKVGPTVTRLQVGAVKVLPTITADGERLHLVQAGQFRTYDQAQRARRLLSQFDTMIVPQAR